MEPQVLHARLAVQIQCVQLQTRKVEGTSVRLDTLHDRRSGQIFYVILHGKESKENIYLESIFFCYEVGFSLTPCLERALAAATAKVFSRERDLNWDSVTSVPCRFWTSSGEKCRRMVCGWLKDVPFWIAV